ncbi:transcriptional regulatory protein moc3 [Achaetomium macrosporum]|uniref:Transcriptional regulatory protein moc3 n=1 Tax=Achaetomium macrosporum TaxID=79813 RepID=A0AAN7CCB5_9PEZI|nr:transcriptional regulatory protein moc3 [Achaetomium macrosporum]
MASVESLPNTGSAEESRPAESPPSASGSKGDQPPPPPTPPKRTKVMRRTKTGCLTCRRRRIKCDEGKPTCNNCIKSKRECDGYNKRLTFKEPLSSFPSGPFSHPPYHRQVQQELINAQIAAAQTKAASSQAPLPVIAPKPPSVDFSGAGPIHFGQGYGSSVNPSMAGAPAFNPPQQLPSPPLLGSDLSSFPGPPPLIHGEPSTHGNFLGVPPGLQDLPHDASSGSVGLPPAFITRHHVPIPTTNQSLVYPESGDGRLDRSLPADNDGYVGYWDSDDEASMAESDDDAVVEPHLVHLEANDLGIQVARRLEPHHDIYGVRIRSFAGLADQNILDTYYPSSSNSPLNDSQTAAVFWYFVNVTGNSMSLYERHPFDPTPLFEGQPVPKQRQHIWTYTFPIMAFNHPALMQAMLALGSLQMAKLQGLPPTAAMKHYHLSLRRIAKNYQSVNRRTQPATLAATLLLGFYEVWNSDHDKWCKHMWGARAVIKDIPFAQMTRDVLAYRQRRKELEVLSHQCNDFCFASHGDSSQDSDPVDTELLLHFTGQRVDYSTGRPARLTQRDVETYEQLRDLYWWFCKMDVYQSFLGGTRLQMEYQQWTQCVPRGPFGRIDSIYGTFDHLMLLLGRLANFSSMDLARKRRARKAQAPPPSQGPPGHGRGQGGPGQQQQGPGMGRGQSPPSFPGLMPTSGRVTVPRGFSPPRDVPFQSSDSAEETDFDASTAKALQEWEEIRQAFEVFRSRLGPDFEPMGPDFAQPEMTPFGPALMYRTYSIAGIWMNYYMGLIVLHRAHPSMPPVAVVAAGMAAQQTGRWANEIARIAAGLHEDTTHVTAISTLFRDIQQRHWTIRRLRDIARLTGWQSARQIAEGCESGWNKAAELGRGPPYHSPPDLGPLFQPESVWSRPRRIDRRIQELEAQAAGENRLVLARSEQAHYALGLLSVEQDLDTLQIDDDVEGEQNRGPGVVAG